MYRKYFVGIGILAVLFFVVLATLTPSVQAQVSSNSQQCVSLTAHLQLGDTDALKNGQVTELQKFLINAHYSTATTTTGIFDQKTLSSILVFQRANGIDLTGIVGPINRDKIKALTCGQLAQVSLTATPKYISSGGTMVFTANVTSSTTTVGYWMFSVHCTGGATATVGGVDICETPKKFLVTSSSSVLSVPVTMINTSGIARAMTGNASAYTIGNTLIDSRSLKTIVLASTTPADTSVTALAQLPTLTLSTPNQSGATSKITATFVVTVINKTANSISLATKNAFAVKFETGSTTVAASDADISIPFVTQIDPTVAKNIIPARAIKTYTISVVHTADEGFVTGMYTAKIKGISFDNGTSIAFSGIETNSVNVTGSTGSTITSITPASGPTATMLTITGTKFSSNNNTVTFSKGTLSLNVPGLVSSNGTSIKVPVPTGLSTGCPAIKPVVVNPNGTSSITTCDPTIINLAAGDNVSVMVTSAGSTSNSKVFTVTASSNSNQKASVLDIIQALYHQLWGI